jgi:hypothetical protein
MNELTTTTDHLPVVETSSTVLAAQAKALVEARYMVAMHRPRDLDVVRARLMADAKRPGFAEVAIYQKPIGKDPEKWPTGPSIRFAEAAIRAMGNCVIEAITIFDDPDRRIVRVTATDLESNASWSSDSSIQKTVERSYIKDGEAPLSSRLNSYNKPVYTVRATDDDILNKVNALLSKSYRTLGLRLVPGDIVDEVENECWKTRRTKDAKDPDAARLQLFDAFGRQGVTIEQLKTYLGHDGKVLTPKEQETLRALFNALRDGETTWVEIMAEKSKVDDAKDGGKAGKADLNAAAGESASSRVAGAKA